MTLKSKPKRTTGKFRDIDGDLKDIIFEYSKRIGLALGSIAVLAMLVHGETAVTKRTRVFTDANGKYKLCEVYKYSDLKSHPGKEHLLDENGNECRLTDGIYLPVGSDNIEKEDAFGRRTVYGVRGIFEKDKTYLPDVSGIPLENILPEDILDIFGSKLSKKEIDYINANLDEYMEAYFENRELPARTFYSDHYDTTREYVEWYYDSKPTLAMYYKCDENGEPTPETVIGYSVWSTLNNIDRDYFYDIRNNQLCSVYDENGNRQYEFKDSIQGIDKFDGVRRDTPYTIEELEALREYVFVSDIHYWKKQGYADYEVQPLFPDAEGTVTYAGWEVMACEKASIDAKDTVKSDIEKANREEKQPEKGE